jgi:hypothetical protein
MEQYAYGKAGYSRDFSPTLFSGSGPVGLPPVLWTKNTIERSPILVQRRGYCCGGDLVGQTTFWIFLSGLQKLEQRAKKCTEHDGEYVQYIRSLIVVAYFLPRRAKNLSAHTTFIDIPVPSSQRLATFSYLESDKSNSIPSALFLLRSAMKEVQDVS